MMLAPHTYAEWINVLEIVRNKTDDVAALDAMKQGTIEWQSGVAERFSRKLIGVINDRMDAASDKFQREIGRANGEERLIIQTLLSLRKEMKFLADMIDLPALPERERLEYKRLVLEQADKMQKSLEDTAKNDRSGRLSSIVRNHKINNF